MCRREIGFPWWRARPWACGEGHEQHSGLYGDLERYV